MASKIQGEGDYESARHYNDDTRRFVDEKRKEGKELKGSAKEASANLTPEEQAALARARGGDQDKRDADLLRNLEKHPEEKKPER
ncbi:MAG TPA: hypothetical protein VFB37_00690 [Steroidobacteraceae bacterium]|nr:hypothetical protein [Steroidobacteraceae bacterium]